MHPLFLLKSLVIAYSKDKTDLDEIVNTHLDGESLDELINGIQQKTSKTIDQKVIAEQQARIEKLTEMTDYLHSNVHKIMLNWRGIDPDGDVCDECDGSGSMVEMTEFFDAPKAFSNIRCVKCGGSGDLENIWPID